MTERARLTDALPLAARPREREFAIHDTALQIRTRLLGPIFADPNLAPKPRSKNPSTVAAALRTVDRALDTLCSTLGLSAAAA